MQSTSNTNINVNMANGIHCKVWAYGTVRRFFSTDTEYNALLERVCKLFGFSKDSVVLKYFDEEGDLVTISSDPELQFAFEIAAPRKLLKLKLELIQSADHAAQYWRFCKQGMCRRNSAERGKFRHRQWPWGNKRPGIEKSVERIQNKISSLKFKQEKLQAKLNSLPESHSSCEKLRAKLAFVSSKVAWLELLAARGHGDSDSDSDSKMEELSRKIEEFRCDEPERDIGSFGPAGPGPFGGFPVPPSGPFPRRFPGGLGCPVGPGPFGGFPAPAGPGPFGVFPAPPAGPFGEFPAPPAGPFDHPFHGRPGAFRGFPAHPAGRSGFPAPPNGPFGGDAPASSGASPSGDSSSS